MQQFKKILLAIATMLVGANAAIAQDAMALVKQVKAKLDKVTDYTATGKMKTDVTFLKVPLANVNVYFKKPNKFKISKQKGISIMPKGGVSVTMQNILTDNNFVALDAGASTINGTAVKVVKLLPTNEQSEVVLTTLYIDVKELLIRKATTTTKENGTYDVELFYNKWASYALPDKMVFSFNTKDYKLPKGVTLEFDDGERPDTEKLKNKKGKVEITYTNYEINKGVADVFFK
jgi:outer membrane lipoprotein-sorting protein